MELYAGIDLHSNNSVVIVLDEQDRTVFARRLANDLAAIIAALRSCAGTARGVAVESTYNWYWLVDGLQDAGFAVHLVNTAAVKQYDGLKHGGDFSDARLGRAALALPGQARQDLWILTAMARELGLDWSAYGAQPQDCTQAVAAVFDEMRRLMPSIAGITWQRLQREGSVTYPCCHEGDAGERVVFDDHFPTPTGRGLFVPPSGTLAEEQPDADYPLVLITGRQLEHWHTGSMTRRSGVLDAIEPDAVALLHPQELARLGVAPGGRITVTSRRGEVELFARADAGMPPGAVFVAFCWAEAAINELTNPALDPVAKIPGFKYCAVRVTPATMPAA